MGRWPDQDFFPLADGQRVPCGFAGEAVLSVTDLGELVLPSGELGASDGFVDLDHPGVYAKVKPGTYPVFVTVADFSDEQGPHLREAYLSVVFHADAVEVRREVSEYAVGVDSGTVALVDAGVVADALADGDAWQAAVEGPGGWLERLEDPTHLREGSLNVALLEHPEANVVICHSGWGDGIYSVVLGYDADDRLVAAHIDLQVVAPLGPFSGKRTAGAESPALRPGLAMAVALVPAALYFAIGMALGFPVEWVVLPMTGIVIVMVAFSRWKGWIR